MANAGGIESSLWGMFNGTDPSIAKQRQVANANIDTSVNKNILNTRENLASSGLGRSGIGVSALNPIFAGGETAKAGLEANLSQQNIQMKQNAIAQLLGLDQLRLGQNSQRLQQMGLFMGGIQNANNLNQQIQSTPSPFMQLLGSLIGAGGQIGAAAMMPASIA